MADNDDDDRYVEFGTPLDPIEIDEVPRKKPIPIQDQVVTDERGRRRFHGAFTGGFSAGYFNTVGTKEGWTPQSFKSTRAERASALKSQSAHDFMDEEDVGAFGIAPQVLRATEDFSLDRKESRKRMHPAPSDGPIPGVPILQQVIAPIKLTIGNKILQRMGWRQGKGIGPKITKAQKEELKAKETTQISKPVIEEVEISDPEEADPPIGYKMYGCALPPGIITNIQGNDDTTEGEQSDEEFLFAPEDVASPLCNPKENTFGLGYKGLDRTSLQSAHVDLFQAPTSLQYQIKNRRLKIGGEAFGVGAFEDIDEDIYSRDDMSQYDIALETPEERRDRMNKEKMDKKAKKKQNKSDGSIEGFVKAKYEVVRKYFAPPKVPDNYIPNNQQGRKSRFEPPKSSKVTEAKSNSEEAKKSGLERHSLTIEERGALLGEARERAKEKAETKKVPEKPEISAEERVSRLMKFTQVLQNFSSNTPQIAHSSFKPFLKNPEKQERYEKYLTLQAAGFKECLEDLQPSEMTEWEREREKNEFDRASALYKPIAGAMSSRFVSAKSHDISHIVPERESVREKDPTEDPTIAAKMGLFGKLTHRVHEWHPDRILCKRFNVPMPYPESKIVGVVIVGTQKDSGSNTLAEPSSSTPEPNAASGQLGPPKGLDPEKKKSLFDNIDFSKPPPGLQPIDHHSTSTATPVALDEPPESSEPMEISSPPRLPMDLFKEIFADTSSEEEEEIVKNVITIPEPRKRNFIHPHPTSKDPRDSASSKPPLNDIDNSLEGKSSVVKGIFDKLDFSKLNMVHHPSNDTIQKDSSLPQVASIPVEEEDFYGPKRPNFPISHSIPKPLDPQSSRTSQKTESLIVRQPDDVIWVEKETVSKKEKGKKHSKKSKKSKKKEKKKKKKSSKNRNDNETSESNSDSDDDIPVVLNANNKALIQKLKEMTRR